MTKKIVKEIIRPWKFDRCFNCNHLIWPMEERLVSKLEPSMVPVVHIFCKNCWIKGDNS